MSRKNRKNKIKIETVIKQYVGRNKKKLINVFGSLDSAVAHLKNDAPLPTSVKSYDVARDLINDYIEEFQYGNEPWFKLKQAKKEAFANTPGAFDKLTQLNKKIDENAYIFDNAPIATGEGNIARNLEGYYEIKNSKYILAYVSVNLSGYSEIRRWEFVKKSDVVTNSEVIA